jgi:hypothetical protein
MFRMDGEYLVNLKDSRVLTVHGNIDQDNRHLIAHKRQGGLNQQWDVVYVDEWKGEPKKGELNEDFGLYVERPFHIVSALKDGRYLDLINNRNMVIKTANARNTQVWYFDQRSLTIKSKLNNQSFDIVSSGRSNNMQIWSTNSNWW